MSNAIDPVERAEVRVRSCPCDGDCSTCELLNQLVAEIADLRNRLDRVSVLSHPESRRHVYRGA